MRIGHQIQNPLARSCGVKTLIFSGSNKVISKLINVTYYTYIQHSYRKSIIHNVHYSLPDGHYKYSVFNVGPKL